MPKIVARKCPWTGKIYTSDEKYREHLLSLRQAHTLTRTRSRKQNVLLEKIATVPTIKEIEEFVLENYHNLALAFSPQYTRQKKLSTWIERVYAAELNSFYLVVDYNKYSPNTHCAPRGKPTNWNRKTELPTYYPGYMGHVSYSVSENDNYNGIADFPAVLKAIGIHTGTGGWRGERNLNIEYEYGVQLFLEDFPALQKRTMKMIFKDKLANTRSL